MKDDLEREFGTPKDPVEKSKGKSAPPNTTPHKSRRLGRTLVSTPPIITNPFETKSIGGSKKKDPSNTSLQNKSPKRRRKEKAARENKISCEEEEKEEEH